MATPGPFEQEIAHLLDEAVKDTNLAIMTRAGEKPAISDPSVIGDYVLRVGGAVREALVRIARETDDLKARLTVHGH